MDRKILPILHLQACAVVFEGITENHLIFMEKQAFFVSREQLCHSFRIVK